MNSTPDKSADTPRASAQNIRDLLAVAIEVEELQSNAGAKFAAWKAVEARALANPQAALGEFRAQITAHSQSGAPRIRELLATKALSLAPESPELTCILASCYLARGLLEQSLQLLSELEDDAAGDVLALRGKAAWLLGKQGLAKAAFYALAAAPERRTLGNLKAAIEFLREQGDRQGLRMTLESISDQHADDCQFCLWMAEWLISEEAAEEANIWLARGIANGDAATPLFWQLWRVSFRLNHREDHELYRKTIALMHEAEAAETIVVLRSLLAKHPEFWEARSFLASTLRRQGILEEALAELLRVVADFSAPQAWLELGALFGELGRHSEALQASQLASELFATGNPFALANIASAHLALGNRAAANAVIEKLEDEYPDARATKGLRAQLAAPRSPRRSGFRKIHRRFGS